MKKLLPLTLLPFLVTSCGLGGTPKTPTIAGTINGTAPEGTVKMAVIGISDAGIVNQTVGQAVVLQGTKYVVDYPANVSDGLYQVIAFVDKNGDNQYQATEPRTKLDMTKYLILSRQGNAVLRYVPGWNYYSNGTITQPTLITDYDLTW